MENYFHIIYVLVLNKISQAMKKYYYQAPTFKLCEGGPGVPLLNFGGGPGVPLLNFRGVPGLTFKL